MLGEEPLIDDLSHYLAYLCRRVEFNDLSEEQIAVIIVITESFYHLGGDHLSNRGFTSFLAQCNIEADKRRKCIHCRKEFTAVNAKNHNTVACSKLSPSNFAIPSWDFDEGRMFPCLICFIKHKSR